MSAKKGSFLEEHVEKMVLAVVGLVCLVLLFTHVLFSPNKVTYERRKFDPGHVDRHLHERALALDVKLRGPAKERDAYEGLVGKFANLIESAVVIDTELGPLSPHLRSGEGTDEMRFNLPKIGGVEQAVAEHIRAVAYLPTVVVDSERAYSQNDSEPNDVDLVTVEARFNVAELYESFYDSFAGDDVEEQWRDPCMAIPVFAAVQLQRQYLLADGSWSDWQDAPRTVVEYRREMFEALRTIEKPSPAEVKMNLYKFDDPEVRRDILQPGTYAIASAEEEWFTPLLHREYLDDQRKADAQEKRRLLEEEKKNEERRRDRPRYGRERGSYGEGGTYRGREPGAYGSRERGSYRGGRDRGSYTGREREEMLESRAIRSTKKVSETKWLDDLYDEFDKILINEKTDLAKMSEPLVFWAHDDTVEPENSYRYRIRLGIFNPVAGTNQVSAQDEPRKGDMILWSDFSGVTEPVEIPATLYFFPIRAHETVKKVTVKVSKYALGYWHGKPFPVSLGEVIGKVVENEVSESKTASGKKDMTLPETVDYSTGAVLVDVTTVNDWSGERNLASNSFCNMLYSFDGTVIEYMPVAMTSWPRDVQSAYREIEALEKRPRKAFRSWSDAAERLTRRARGRRIRRGGEDEEEGDWTEADEEAEALRRMFER
jgi:hypothetical protein